MVTRSHVGCVVLVGWICAVLSGCSERDPFPTLHPLTGTVMRDGKAVTSGGLLFVLETGERTSLVVNAAVRADGTFAAETIRTGDRGSETRPGAPIGRYKVIYHPPSNGSKTGLEVELDQRVTVEAKENTATINLPLVMPQGAGIPRDDDPTRPKQEPKDEPKQ